MKSYMSESTTVNYELTLVDDNDLIKTAIQTIPNANWDVIDVTAKDIEDSIPDSLTTAQIDTLLRDSTRTVVKVYSGTSLYSQQFAFMGDTLNVSLPTGTLELNTESDGSGTAYVIGDLVPLENPELTLYALSSHTATFLPNGGEGETITTDGLRITAPECTFTPPDGQVFTCWSTSATGTGVTSGEIYLPGEEIILASAKNLYARYDLYVVDYYSKLDAGEPDEYNYMANITDYIPVDRAGFYGTNIGLDAIACPVPTGRVFGGWFTRPYGDGSSISPSINAARYFGNDVTSGPFSLYGYIIVCSWQITYHPNFDLEDRYGSANWSSYFSIPTVLRTGYYIDKWVDANNKELKSGLIFGQSMLGIEPPYPSTLEYTAQWVEKTTLVHYNTQTDEVTVPDRIFKFTEPGLGAQQVDRFGYNAPSWYLIPNPGISASPVPANASMQSYIGDDPVITLYAKWSKKFTTINWLANDTELAPASVASGKLMGLYGTTVTFRTLPTREGYVVSGLSLTAEGATFTVPDVLGFLKYYFLPELQPYYTGDSSLEITVYIQWCEPFSYSIAFDSNGGTGTMTSLSATWGTVCVITANEFTAPEGKQFYSWNTRADGTGTSVFNSASVKTPYFDDIINDVFTLYAQWVDIQS